MTTEKLLSFSTQERQDTYQSIYSSYLIAIDDNNEKLISHYESVLQTLRIAWELSVTDIITYEAQTSFVHAHNKEFLKLMNEDQEDTPPTIQ